MSEKTKTDQNSIAALLATMTPEIHQALKTAVELGHWENGEKLTVEQKEHCLQAIIAYDKTFISPQERVGFINREGSTCSKGEAEREKAGTDHIDQSSKDIH